MNLKNYRGQLQRRHDIKNRINRRGEEIISIGERREIRQKDVKYSITKWKADKDSITLTQKKQDKK